MLNLHAPTEDKIDDIKDRFYEELEQVFDKFQATSICSALLNIIFRLNVFPTMKL
jgi:hypothetical protein